MFAADDAGLCDMRTVHSGRRATLYKGRVGRFTHLLAPLAPAHGVGILEADVAAAALRAHAAAKESGQRGKEKVLTRAAGGLWAHFQLASQV
jgi:hypothetical protein